jgi:branched-chain amino acid transport system permease protein
MLDVPIQAIFGQLLLGAINGAFYALLSLGLAIIFGLLHVVNFAHGAQYTLGAFAAYLLLKFAGIPYWAALILAPLIVGTLGIVFERLFLRRLYDVDSIYQLLLTFSLALIIEGTLRALFGSSGIPYNNPMPGGVNLGFMFLPYYRGWVVALSLALCLATWLIIEKTKLGSYLRAATERPDLVRTFGINVPLMITLTYGWGVALAALAGVLAAPIYQVNPGMGANLLIIVFAVVVIGGMGSLAGSIIAGFGLGIVEGMTKLFYPAASTTVIFAVMVFVLLVKPAGIFGREVR